jgi:hypothetical protein
MLISRIHLCWLAKAKAVPLHATKALEGRAQSLCAQTGYAAHPASCTMGTGAKARPGRDADHSPPSSAQV